MKNAHGIPSWLRKSPPVCSFLSIFLILLFSSFVVPATILQAEERVPSVGPVLRVESGMHAGLARRIDSDAEGRYLVSVSDDKTLKIWSVGDGRLQSTMRVPIGLGNEGALHAVAFSPDGRTVAVTGQTGPEWDDGYCIYLIDVQGGEIRRRIVNLPEAVTHMAFSPNGVFLAAVFGERAGLQVFTIPDGTRIYASEPYQVPANWVDFAPDGRMVVSSYDGALRMYDANFRPSVAKQLAKGGKPHGVAFSPDGKKIAVGFRDRATVAVLSADDLTLSYLPDVSGVAGNLWTVGWSADGTRLLGAGSHAGRGKSLIRWWSHGGLPDGNGRGEYMDLPASNGNVMQILPLKSGGVAFTAADPALGVLDGQGFAVFTRERAIANFQGGARRLLVSDRGNVVEFDYDASGSNRGRFTVDKLLLQSAPTPGAGLHEPLVATDEVNVTGWWGDGSKVTFNGMELSMSEKEISCSLGIDAKNRFFALGSSFSLRLYLRSGQLRWQVHTPGPVWAVNVSGNGQWVIAALGDGTIRWYDAMRGEESMALFVSKDQQRWAVWSARNFFAVSPGASSLIGWHVNRGKGQLADFYPVGQFPQYQNSEFFKTLFQQ
ncbi:hypothetical protein SIID45300_02524 [Candidatus Magnetaquicoccaceae bacterium FCR-1]|uniref:WD40 repeat domain-containing protein n=1 Tax=Candidatus Magnetaquiglobus chichijimensis TaxID=3141448 RepID=A0ABQ0CBE4_9PROT